MSIALGIDIGGSGIKAAPVDLDNGVLIAERRRVETPQPAQPAKVIAAIGNLLSAFPGKEVVGIGFPGIIRDEVIGSAANLHPSWIGLNLARSLEEVYPDRRFHAINDADAAGVAEMAYGAGRGCRGTVLVLTLGTGLGSALFRNGELIPNMEFGHLHFNARTAEKWAAASVRKLEKLTWSDWARRLDEVLAHMEFLFSPERIILGGGVSAKSEKFFPFLSRSVQIVPAQLQNQAGIIGAAAHAAMLIKVQTQ